MPKSTGFLMTTLHLTLKKKWFDLIKSGSKTEEYREIKSYWDKRLVKNYTQIKFRNGYAKNSPNFIIELKGIEVGFGNVQYGAPSTNKVYILKLGNIIER